MNCPRCAVENEEIRKFCHSCGAPMGILCDRCATVNSLHDKYCGNCGFALTASVVDVKKGREGSAMKLGGIPRQYTDEEIQELLQLRFSQKQGTSEQQQLDQNEIDAIFS